MSWIKDPQILKNFKQNLLVLVTDENEAIINAQSTLLNKLGIDCLHIDFYMKNVITTSLLKKFAVTKIIDCNNNTVLLDEYTSPKIQINYYKNAVYNTIIDLCGTTSTNGIVITVFGNNARINLGRSSYNKAIVNVAANSKVICGDDCMFSSVSLMQSDQHHIFDIITKQRINNGKDIIVGNHVWLGREVMLLGGANIPDNCIVGARSTTSGRFHEKNAVIAGNPAKIIRKGVIWARDELYYDYPEYSMCKDQAALKYMEDDIQ